MIVILLCCLLCGCQSSGIADTTGRTDPTVRIEPSTQMGTTSVAQYVTLDVEFPEVPFVVQWNYTQQGAYLVNSIEYACTQDGTLSIQIIGENIYTSATESLVSFKWSVLDDNGITVTEGYFSAGVVAFGEKFSGEIVTQIPYSGSYRFHILGISVSDDTQEPVDVSKMLTVRLMMFTNKEHAQALLDDWYAGVANDESLALLMNSYYNDWNDASLYAPSVYHIMPGDFVAELDAWCFAEERAAGDITILELAYEGKIMYTLCYICALPTA